MKRQFHLYLREHHTGWFTSSVLTHPHLAAFGPHPSKLREELAEVLAERLATGTLELRQETFFESMQQRSLNLELKAAQHERLISVPMRFTLLERVIDEKAGLFEVRIPRLQEVFRIHGRENVNPWAEEVIRAHFRLVEVSRLLAHQYEKSERVEELEVVYHGPGRYKKRLAALRTERDEDGGRREPEPPAHPLAALGPNLTGEAEAGRLPRAQFRDTEVAELLAILSSQRSRSALLVGPSGSGKTAVIQEAAHRLASGSAELGGVEVWSIPGSRMLAGARFLGEWQAKVLWILERIRADRSVLYAGNIVELLTSDTGKTGLNVAQLLLGPVQDGDISVIVEATPDALSLAERANAPFVSAFQRLPIRPLPAERTNVILERAAQRLAKEQSVEWAPGAVSAALDVIARFGDAQALPGSGLVLLEQMSRAGAPAVKSRAPRVIEPKSAIAAFSRGSGFPEALLDPSRLLDPAEIRAFFDARVLGQPRATELITHVIMLLKAGLNDPSKPLGSLLFMGPTGVGKTETALALAEYLFRDRKRLLRFDMSELGYPGSALRLIDGPGGQGELTKAVRAQPFSVILFDEVEKADPSVFDVLLQVLGEGRLTDGTGHTVRLTHTIIIMTSNLGAVAKEAVGFGSGPGPVGRLDRHYLDAAAKFFRPELLNRLDHLVPFSALGAGELRSIGAQLLAAAITREGLVRRGVKVTWDPTVLDLLAREGFDPKYGARPMKRAVEAKVMVPLAQRLVAWPAGSPGSLHLSAPEGVLLIDGP